MFFRSLTATFIFSLLFAVIGYCQVTKERIKLETKSGVCAAIDGDAFIFKMNNGRVFYSGAPAIFDCNSEAILIMMDIAASYSIEVKDSVINFNLYHYFYTPSTKSYDRFASYCLVTIKADADGNTLAEQEYIYKGKPISEEEVFQFTQNLDEIFENDDYLLSEANAYGFSDMLFYCAIAGDTKAAYYFRNLEGILKERGLLSEYGGEPAQNYALLLKIYNNGD